MLDIEATLRAAPATPRRPHRRQSRAGAPREALVIAGRVFEAALCPDAPEEGASSRRGRRRLRRGGRGRAGRQGRRVHRRQEVNEKKKAKTPKHFRHHGAGAQMPGQEQLTVRAAEGGISARASSSSSSRGCIGWLYFFSPVFASREWEPA